MTMADVLTVTFILIGLMITLPALWLLMRALFPAAVGRSRDRIASRPISCFFLGLGAAAVLALVSGVLSALGGPPGKVASAAVLVAAVILSGVGLAGFSAIVGERLPSTADDGRPWRGLVRGAVCLELTFLLPIIGWFGVLPLALATGLGAAILALSSPAGPLPAPGQVPAVSPVPTAA